MLSAESGSRSAEREVAALRTELEVLKRQVKSLRREVREQSEFIDTVTSALWKRLWWWVGGYYFRKVGRWYGYATRTYRAWLWVCDVTGLPE